MGLPVIYLPSAKTFLKKIKEKELKRLYLDAISEIATDPDMGTAKTGDLSGIMGYDIYYQGNNYELAYRIGENDDGEIVVVIMAGPRENFYAQLKSYIKSSKKV